MQGVHVVLVSNACIVCSTSSVAAVGQGCVCVCVHWVMACGECVLYAKSW